MVKTIFDLLEMDDLARRHAWLEEFDSNIVSTLFVECNIEDMANRYLASIAYDEYEPLTGLLLTQALLYRAIHIEKHYNYTLINAKTDIERLRDLLREIGKNLDYPDQDDQWSLTLIKRIKEWTE